MLTMTFLIIFMMFRFSGGKKEVAAVVEEKSVESEVAKKDHEKHAKPAHNSPRYVFLC